MSDDEIENNRALLFELFFTTGKILDILLFEYERTFELKKSIDKHLITLQLDLKLLKEEYEDEENYGIVSYDEISRLETLIGSYEFSNIANKNIIDELFFISDKNKSKYVKLDNIKTITIERLGQILSAYKHTNFQLAMAISKYQYYNEKQL